jgi:hypothetical protein
MQESATAQLEARRAYPGPESVGDRFVLAAEAGMELTGRLIRLQDDTLVAVD